ncbi:MAG: ComEC/Rec2 family competence protein [Bacteroidia bacterium]
MRPYSQVPILRLLLPLCLGIVCGIFSGISIYPVLAVMIISFLIMLAYIIIRKLKRSFSYRHYFGVAVFIFFIATGFMLIRLNTTWLEKYHYTQFTNAEAYLIRLSEPWHQKAKSIKAEGDVVAVRVNNAWKATRGKTLVYFENSNSAKNLEYGSLVITQVHPQEIPPPLNPGSFNYKRFLSFHQIYNQFYLPADAWSNEGMGYRSRLWQQAYAYRDLFLSEISNQILIPREVAVCSALLVGYVDQLDADLVSAYARSGALHVLSVSGLHVGLIFVLLQKLFFFMDKNKLAYMLKQLFIILLIWFYAFITGLSAPILRSAMMISIILIAKYLRRDSYMLNTTLASAFIILCINPFALTEVGFQLSYLAVIGIVYLHQRFVTLFYTSNHLLNAAWQLTSVSICAQLVTFPLGLLYFNQFPNLFLISNLAIIPISTVVIWVAVAALMLSFVSYLSVIVFWLWKIVFALTWLMNEMLVTAEQFRFAVIKGVYLTIGQTWLIYIIMAMAVWFLLYKNRRAVYLFYISSFLLILSFIYDQILINNQKKLIVYAIKGQSAIEIMKGNRKVFISSDEVFNDKSLIRFNIERYWYETGMKQLVHLPMIWNNTYAANKNDRVINRFVATHENFLCYEGKLIYIPTGFVPFSAKDNRIKVHTVIVTDQCKNKLSTLLQRVETKNLIIDASSKIKIKDVAFPSGTNVYDLRKQGAAMIEM